MQALPFIAQLVCACTITQLHLRYLSVCQTHCGVSRCARSHTSDCEILVRNTATLITLDM